MRVLTRNVVVHTDVGSESVGPGPCPDRLARLITMPGVWADEDIADPEDPADTPGSDEIVERPPETGKGSGVDAWRSYAEALDLDVDDDMSKADIIAVIDAHEASED